jgi:hypothetical protein
MKMALKTLVKNEIFLVLAVVGNKIDLMKDKE